MVLNTRSVDTFKHQVMVHSTPYKKQPQGKEMGLITNGLKRSYSRPLPIEQILNYFSRGHSIMLSSAEVDQDNRFNFISSSLFAIDVDDDQMVTNPEEVVFRLKDQLVGMFYTFSHGIKGNRYRLVFQLDRTINDELKMRGIIDLVARDLKSMGLPVDVQAKNPLQIVRGGKKHLLVNKENRLNTTELLERLKREEAKRQQNIYNDFKQDLRPIPFTVLKEMARKIGYIPSGTGEGELWKRVTVGIKHYVNTGFISNEEGFELFDIVSGGEQTEKAWNTLRANGQATIGSFVHEAKKKGHKWRYNVHEKEPVKETFERETIRVKDYIPTEAAKDLILRKQKILVDSPTGSGKTTSFLNAFKELASSKKHFYIFATPTIALTEQNATSHKVRAIKGKTANLFKVIHQDVKNGKRVFISTYDMTPILIDFLRMMEKNITFTLVVDELHKFVTDYDLNYRFTAIRNLYEVSKEAESFIGLSGTIDDIYKNEFEVVVKIDNGKPQSPCQEFAIYTYDKRDNALAELAQLIETWSAKRKLLIYIQSKKKIEHLKNVLRKKGIKVRAINANSKSNLTYKQLVEQATIDQDVQVVLTTSVIADGINIKNSIDWEVIAVCNDFSNLFNYSSIKQISNRLRNTYRRFSLFMQTPKNENEDPFRLENAYQSRIEIADRIVSEINNHAYFDPKLFHSSEIERNYGIKLAMEQNLEYDTLHLRHAVSKEQERYFYGNRLAFVKAVEKVLVMKAKGSLNITEEIRKKRLDVTFYQTVLTELHEQEKADKEEKESRVYKTFTPEVHAAFLNDEETILNEFKKETVPSHYSCVHRLSRIADYEVCKKIVTQVKRDADTHSFYENIRALVDTLHFQAIDRPNKTRTVFLKLLKINKPVSNEDYKKIIKDLARKHKLKEKDIRLVEKMVLFVSERHGKERTRLKRVEGSINAQYIAEKFTVPLEKVKVIAVNYAKAKNDTILETVVKNKFIPQKQVGQTLFSE